MPDETAPVASKLTLPSDREIQIDRTFDAPRALVWRAFTEAALLPKWVGPAKYEMTTSQLDVRTGGKYRWAWSVPPGELVIRGQFETVEAPVRMVTKEFMEPNPEPSHNTTTFSEADGRTTVSIVMKVASKAARDAILATGMQGGMDEGYDRLEKLLRQIG